MRRLLLFFLMISSFTYAQLPNIDEVWLNNNRFYTGTIGNSGTELKLKIMLVDQDHYKDGEYLVSGISVVDNNLSNFEGKLKVTQYQSTQDQSTASGTYNFAEETKGKHSGIFKGKFTYTFELDSKTEKIRSQHIEFIGDWKSYDGTLVYRTNLKNQ